MVSSGTDGIPKMVAYSHNALATGLESVVAETLVNGRRPRSAWLVPVSSAFAASAVIGTMIMHGGTLILQDHFEAAAALQLVARHRPTHLYCVPTMLRLLLARCADRTMLGGRGPEMIVAGGERLDEVTR